jgi:hypothetical protein
MCTVKKALSGLYPYCYFQKRKCLYHLHVSFYNFLKFKNLNFFFDRIHYTIEIHCYKLQNFKGYKSTIIKDSLKISTYKSSLY